MFLRSTTKPLMLEVWTNKTHMSEAFRIVFVNTSMLLRSTTKPHMFSIRARFDQTSLFFYEGGNRASVLTDSNKYLSPPRGGFLLGGFLMRGVDRTKLRCFVFC